jgi:hypothetical protein
MLAAAGWAVQHAGRVNLRAARDVAVPRVRAATSARAGRLPPVRRRAGDRRRRERVESERFRRFGYDELVQRDKVSLDLAWLRDESLEDADNLPPPEVIAQEIVDDLEAALAEFAAVAEASAQGRRNQTEAMRPTGGRLD